MPPGHHLSNPGREPASRRQEDLSPGRRSQAWIAATKFVNDYRDRQVHLDSIQPEPEPTVPKESRMPKSTILLLLATCAALFGQNPSFDYAA